MKIVDSFLFSEPYEKELLLLKFILEDSGVDEWIILENSYSFQGSYIGLSARKIIDGDERFAPFRSRITFIEKEVATKPLEKHKINDEDSYKVEFWQRDLAHDYFVEKYNDEDWIFISDVDEMIDFTDPQRKKELSQKITASKEQVLFIPVKRFWYDFDNEYKVLLWRPLCSKSHLAVSGKKLHEVRVDSFRYRGRPWNNVIGFEYSSCYDKAFVLRKFYTSTHTGFTANDMLQSLRCNHRPVHEVASLKPENDDKYFFEQVKLTESNAPLYVRTNLQKLKTNIIDPQYKKNRRTDYPELFSLKHTLDKKRKNLKTWFRKKQVFLLRKLKLEKLLYGSSAH
ncbi:hypothetical protein I5907_12890 [Panacibacter sp. DH6]|uniref:Uncharacterized protein n=1 Tax=Panacibacter microcysteis TaxID=2793269 RepID=A0A931E6L8_9BACT|nr:hypothetical protein [Panacibacter microcysteis]MBG9377132.1 hypothetical protein [Panacibacter microcysteis]